MPVIYAVCMLLHINQLINQSINQSICVVLAAQIPILVLVGKSLLISLFNIRDRLSVDFCEQR